MKAFFEIAVYNLSINAQYHTTYHNAQTDSKKLYPINAVPQQ